LRKELRFAHRFRSSRQPGLFSLDEYQAALDQLRKSLLAALPEEVAFNRGRPVAQHAGSCEEYCGWLFIPVRSAAQVRNMGICGVEDEPEARQALSPRRDRHEDCKLHELGWFSPIACALQ